MPEQIGAHEAISTVPDNYTGTCKVIEDNGVNRIIAVLPTVEEAIKVASYAITPDGGFGNTRVEAAPGIELTHQNFNEWAF